MLRAIQWEKAINRPPLPESAEILELNEHYSTTLNAEPFVLLDEIFRGDRLLIFASNFFLFLLFAADIVCCDGTFQTVPSIFNQLYTLNFFYYGKLLPAVYVLTKRRTALVYQRVFSILHREAERRNRVFSPQEIVGDFESAVILSCRIEFPQSKHRGCYFHFCQVLIILNFYINTIKYYKLTVIYIYIYIYIYSVYSFIGYLSQSARVKTNN